MAIKELVTFNAPNSIVSEQYRAIRTNIHFSTVGRRNRALAITSPDRGEGKTTTAINLSVSMAQNGQKVLLVDTDLRKPSIHSIFKMNNQVGLTDILVQEAILQEAVTPTNIAGLTVLTSGPVPVNPAELLGSPAMESLLKSAVNAFDIIIFDTPPVIDVTDARIIANQCDGVILVVNQGKTEGQRAVEAKRLLELARSNVLGVVFNKKI